MRTAPPRWQEELAQITGPRSDRFTWLMLYWWPGEAWQEINRWSIWEMIPLAYMQRRPEFVEQAKTVVEGLQGPPPRTLRVFDGAGDFMYSKATVTQDQWDLYRATGCYARPFWVIQGSEGGHKWRFSPPEEMLLRLHGLPSEPPAPGDLPYAEWDARVRQAIVTQRELHDASLALLPLGVKDEDAHLVLRKAKEKDFRRQLLAWLKPQIHQQVSENDSVFKAIDLPIGREVTDEQLERQEEAFVEDTSTQLGR